MQLTPQMGTRKVGRMEMDIEAASCLRRVGVDSQDMDDDYHRWLAAARRETWAVTEHRHIALMQSESVARNPADLTPLVLVVVVSRAPCK